MPIATGDVSRKQMLIALIFALLFGWWLMNKIEKVTLNKEMVINEQPKPSLDTIKIISGYLPQLVTKKSFEVYQNTKDTIVLENQKLIRCRKLGGGIMYLRYKNSKVDNNLLNMKLLENYCFEITCVSSGEGNPYYFVISFIVRKMENRRAA